MAGRKMIGVVIPAVTEELDTLFLDGIYRQVKAYGYDTVAFTCSSNTQGETIRSDYILGEEKIYQLVSRVDLDGVIFAGGKFHDRSVADRILESLRGISCPCVCTDYENDLFPSYHTDQRDSIRMITEHLINDHGSRNIMCLTGPVGNRDAEERLDGWRTAVRSAGLDDSSYIYGDFWKDKAICLADDIAAGIVRRPEAVVCASDIMAITLCERLAANGIKVPDDIAVTGYDGGQNALVTTPSITTVNGKEFDTGSNAAAMLMRLITGDESISDVHTQYISFGTSCGCKNKEDKHFLGKYHEKFMITSECREIRMMSNYINIMASADSLTELSLSIDTLAYILPYWEDMYIGISPEFDNIGKSIGASLPEDYTDRMKLFVSKHRGTPSDEPIMFDTSELIPANVRNAAPQFVAVTPLHNSGKVYGYIAAAFDDPKQYSFDDLYIGWRDSISNALSVQYIKAQNRLLNQRLAELSERDALTGMLNLKGMTERIAHMNNANENYSLVILEMKWVQKPKNKFEIDSEIFISNAIQMNCSVHDICFRYNESIFGIFLRVPDDLEPKSCCDEWTIRFDSFVEMIVQREESFEKPVIRFYYEYFSGGQQIGGDIELMIKFRIGSREKRHEDSLYYTQQLDELLRRMKRSPELDWDQSVISAEMKISESYFRRIYKQHFGTSFHSDLVDLRIGAAMKLLKKTDMSISVIAAKCGYKNIYHFMTSFRKKTGMTAKEYRDSAHK